MEFKSFLGGVVVASAVAGIAWHYQPKPTTPDPQIVFPDKIITDTDGYIILIGTITGKEIGYPNNTLYIRCSRDDRRCDVATVQQIGKNQVGPIDLDDYLVTRWDDGIVTAKENTEGTTACSAVTLNIIRHSGEVQWIQEPVNQTAPNCIHADATVYKWTVQPSPYYVDFHKRVSKE
jgi:hypothetical protein